MFYSFVWRTVLSGDVDWLTERISSFEMPK
jgi:hypothetical protein